MDKLRIREVLNGAWKALRIKYFMNVLVVFIVGLIMGGYAMNTYVGKLTDSPQIELVQTQQILNNRSTGQSNAQSLEDLLDYLSSNGILPAKEEIKTAGQQYTKGVLSVFVNQISTSEDMFFGILNGVNMIVFKGSVSRSVVIFVTVVALVVFNLFVSNIITVGKNRYFLEHRRYADTKADKVLFVYKFNRTWNVALIMFLRSLFQALWNLTIVGGIIKTYEYSMIPYIVAENPDIKWRDAFYLSKKMTNGDKRRLFLLDLILVPGYLLSPFTLNLISVFLMSPYENCVRAETYMQLRSNKRTHIPRAAELLGDRMLAVVNVSDSIYPDSAFTLPIPEKRRWMRIDYERNYSFSTIVLLFFTYALVGYIWEVFYTLLNEGLLVNRGTMNGPWLPIYGVGGLIIIVVLKPLRRNPLLMFAGTTVACGVLEYFASWLLEYLFDAKWWDYQGYFLNINGRICLEGLLVFGLAGVAFTYVFSPLLDNLYSNIGMKARKIICTALLVVFFIDMVLSALQPNTGDGVTYGEGGMGADTVVIETTSDQH
ncbi:MAG: DUF975 family protein [Clostridiales bacterium]|nr:DUF975 family protein [Clostridiales bacterium]